MGLNEKEVGQIANNGLSEGGDIPANSSQIKALATNLDTSIEGQVLTSNGDGTATFEDGSAPIDDATVAPDKLWSSQKTNSQIQTIASANAEAEIVGLRTTENGYTYDVAEKASIAQYKNKANTGFLEKEAVNDFALQVGRVRQAFGTIQGLGGYSYATVIVEGYTKYKAYMFNSGGNDFGYAFYDASDTYISGNTVSTAGEVEIDIPASAKTIKYGAGDSDWDTGLSDYATLENLDDLNQFTLNKRVLEIENVLTIDTMSGYGYVNLIGHHFLGAIPSFITGVLIGSNTINPENVISTVLKKGMYEMSKVGGGDFTDSVNDRVINFINLDTYMWLDMSELTSGFSYSQSSGATISVDAEDVVEGNILKRFETDEMYVEILKVSDNYTFIRVHSSLPADSETYEEGYFSARQNISTITVINPISLEETDVDINPYSYYNSLPENTNSLLVGKKCVILGDSQYNDGEVARILSEEYGLNTISTSFGGHSIKYRSGSSWMYEQGKADVLFTISDVDFYVFTMSTNDGSGGGDLTTIAIDAVLDSYPEYDDDAGTITSKLAIFNGLTEQEKEDTFNYLQTYGAYLKQIYRYSPLSRIICCSIPIDFGGSSVPTDPDVSRDELISGKLSIREDSKNISEWFQTDWCDFFTQAGISYDNFLNQNIDIIHWQTEIKYKLARALSAIINRQ